MSAETRSREARPYRPPMPRSWWLRRRSYFLFAAREVSSVFVAWFVVFLLLLIWSVARGEDAYRRFVEWSANPFVLALNVLALVFVVLHAVTWFNLAPAAMVVKVRGRRLPPVVVAGAHFAAWAVASALVVWIVLG